MQNTLKVLMALCALGGLWEAWTIVNRTDGDTFSATIRKLATNQPFITFAVGLVCGHLFWPLLDGEKVVVIKEEEKK